MARPKPPISLWIASERKRHGWKVGDLSEKLTALNLDAAETTVRTWEAGRPPKAETIDALERLFGSPAPRGAETPDLGGLLAALSSQTEALNRVAERLEAQSTSDLRDVVALTVEATLRGLAEQGLLVVPGAPARQPARRENG